MTVVSRGGEGEKVVRRVEVIGVVKGRGQGEGCVTVAKNRRRRRRRKRKRKRKRRRRRRREIIKVKSSDCIICIM